MDESDKVTWGNLMDLTDFGSFNSPIKGDILNEDDNVKINDCMANKTSYKRTFNDMDKFSITNNEVKNVSNKKFKFK
jgi:hypothetical protein